MMIMIIIMFCTNYMDVNIKPLMMIDINDEGDENDDNIDSNNTRWMIKTKPSEMVGMKDLDVDVLEFNKKYMSSREGLIADISRQRKLRLL